MIRLASVAALLCLACSPDSCVDIRPEVAHHWPNVHSELDTALERWRQPYTLGGADCAVVISIDRSPKIAAGWPPTTWEQGGIWLNDRAKRPIVDSDCQGGQYQLAAVLTHELGHTFDLRDDYPSRDAMGRLGQCEDLHPTDDERARATRW